MKCLIYLASLLLYGATKASCQLPVKPEYDQVVRGALGEGFQVSLKQNSICETTPGVKSYSGYITTPPSSNSATTVNTFYWFFESRKNPQDAPFVIWLGGGPGFNSISSAVSEMGPCIVGADSNSTTLNPWSFNNEANLLFIDQPVQTGFSYGQIINGTVNQLNASGVFVTPLENGAPVPAANGSFNVGAFPTQGAENTSNSTANAAVVFWQDIQTWFQAFPQYMPKNKSLSIWTESYGGRYAPLFARYFGQQNDLIKRGQISNATAFTFDTLGIGNGYVDALSHVQSYLNFAVNNTYGIKMVNSTVESLLQTNLTKPGGCLDQVNLCQKLEAASDPQDFASNSTVDDACAAAFVYCDVIQTTPTALSMLSQDDIAQQTLVSVMKPYYNGFFAQGWVMQALGAAVNFTDNAAGPLAAFVSTGDLARGEQLQALGELLDTGTAVTLAYGDRDYEVNWFGGENASLAMPWHSQTQFNAAGYANFTTNSSYVGGLVRQTGDLAFVRVFQSGHQIGYYQPETLYRIFQRTLARKDLQDGMQGGGGSKSGNCTGTFTTKGVQSTLNVKEAPPSPQAQFCYTLSAPLTCTPEQLAILASGKGVVKDFILQGNGTQM